MMLRTTTIRFLHAFVKVINIICGFGHILGEIGMFFLLAIVVYSVVMRYIFNNPPLWGEEISCYLLIFISWIAIGGVEKDNHHISLDLAVKVLPPKGILFCKIATSFVGLLFCMIISFYGIKYSLFQFQFNLKSTSLLEMPLWIPYMFIPIGFALISLQYLVKIPGYFSLLFNKKNLPEGES